MVVTGSNNNYDNYSKDIARNNTLKEDYLKYHKALLSCERAGLPITDSPTGTYQLQLDWGDGFAAASSQQVKLASTASSSSSNSDSFVRSNLRFDRICVLYNIGILTSKLTELSDNPETLNG